MIASMTGFGKGETACGDRTFVVEIRTVNHRYTDYSIRLPRTLAAFETRVKDLLKEKIRRGHIAYQLSWDKGENNNSDILSLNEEAIRRYQELFRRMNKEFGIQGDPSLETFSRLPDVFKAEPRSEDEEMLWASVQQATNTALEELISMRGREGEALVADIRQRLELMEKNMDQARQKAPERLSKLKNDLQEKVKTALGDQVQDESRLLVEITYYADKWDFSEEVVRFQSHLAAMRETLRAGGEVGRRLGFLIQELNRETNTVSSKANDADIAQLMVAIKEEIEKIREQVENLE